MAEDGFTPPTVSGSNYFTDWTNGGSAFIVQEQFNSSLTGNYWIALYDANGKMIACQQAAESFAWSASFYTDGTTGNWTTMYLADFTEDQLRAAATAKRFYFGANSWIPGLSVSTLNRT
jgi:hypothetical protein